MAEISASASTSASTPSQDYHPAIDPATFDLVVSGTGLPESLLAAAAAAAGKSVLHLDPNPFYGSHFASIPLPSFSSLLSPSYSSPSPHSSAASTPSYDAIDLHRRPIYSEIETSGSPPEPSRSFLVDLAGPRVLYCADAAVDLLLRSGASHHVEFKSVDASLVYWEGRLSTVPDSRQAIFKDRTLSLAEKSQMMRFLKLVQGHIASDRGGAADEGLGRISEEDLLIPFVEFLQKQRLPLKIRAIILYAIAMADYDQEIVESNKLVTTKEGVETIALYSSSIGRFTNSVGAFLYPMYGHGELPQAFCRCAAVKGALYVLRMPVVSLLIDREKSEYVGVRLATGQDIFSSQLVMEPSCQVPPSLSLSEDLNTSSSTGNVARGVCITSSSLERDSSSVLVVFPPKSLYSEQLTTIRVLQLSSNVAVCPPGLFMVYLSTPCNDAIIGKDYIKAAIHALFATNTLGSSEGSVEPNTEDKESETRPTVLWSCVYVQELAQGSFGPVCLSTLPDEHVDYRNIIESTKELFSKMYSQAEFLPQTSEPGDIEDDNGSAE
ncbi:Rab proteins geranylgeranyltransferase component A [Ananas comosus]|uniref:Rab escort protein 1 n=1 Tax=Ananas comosus TaxID=4615 RepID=A0A199V9S1_ANACO|nr:Rab proteins geranylgeranyltransferase component A [Ananas comosus]